MKKIIRCKKMFILTQITTLTEPVQGQLSSTIGLLSSRAGGAFMHIQTILRCKRLSDNHYSHRNRALRRLLRLSEGLVSKSCESMLFIYHKIIKKKNYENNINKKKIISFLLKLLLIGPTKVPLYGGDYSLPLYGLLITVIWFYSVPLFGLLSTLSLFSYSVARLGYSVPLSAIIGANQYQGGQNTGLEARSADRFARGFIRISDPNNHEYLPP